MWRVSSQSTTSAARSSREHAQRDVVEVPDRRRADGERHRRSRRASNATQPGADQPRRRCRARRARSARRRPRRPSASRGTTRARRDRGRSRRRPPKPPPITTSSGLKMLHERCDSRSELPADPGERLDCARCLLRSRARDELVRVGRGPERSARAASARAPGARTAPDARGPCTSLAGQAVVLDHDVPELGPAAVELPPMTAPPPTPVPSVSMIIELDVRAGPELELAHRRPRSRRCRSRPEGRIAPVILARKSMSVSGMFTRLKRAGRTAGRSETGRRTRCGRDPSVSSSRRRRPAAGEQRRPGTASALRRSRWPLDVRRPRSTTPARIFVAADDRAR